jgi:hypothetical protein
LQAKVNRIKVSFKGCPILSLGSKALSRRIREVPGGYALREGVAFYNADFDPKKSDIGLKNTTKWIFFQ